MSTSQYPMWKYYPSWQQPPSWVDAVIAAFVAAQPKIDSRANSGVTSDAALAVVRPALVQLGFEVEASKSRKDKLTRPVLYGEVGESVVAFEVDGFHRQFGIVLEVEAGRGAMNNADYRDLIRASLMVDAAYLVLAMMLQYSGGGAAVKSYEATRGRIDAIYASERLKLPLKGILLIGY